MSYENYRGNNDSYYSGGSQWSQSGGNQGASTRGAPYAWSQNASYSDYVGAGSGGAGNMGSSGNGAASISDMKMLMSQVQQLQQKVLELTSRGSHEDRHESRRDDPMRAERPRRTPQAPNGIRRILLVNNLPPSLASCDSVYYMFEKFGTVERVKILQKQRSTALVQMSSPEEAEKAVCDQDILKKTSRDIFVDFATNVTDIKMPSEQYGQMNEGLTKDYTGAESTPEYNPPPMYGGDGHSLLGVAPGLSAYEGALLHNALNMTRQDQMDPSGANGPCILVSSVPEELANPDSLCNLFGFYGDVVRVKILHNKRDCALIQLSKPNQATLCKNFLDQAKVFGKKICVSFSRMTSIKLPTDIGIDDDASTKDYSNVKGVHRFRNPQLAQKLIKNLCAPTSVLHVANLPDDFSKESLREYITENGFTVKDIQDCGKEGSMALVQLTSVEESIACLSKLHNKSSPEMKAKNSGGLCFSFSNRRING